MLNRRSEPTVRIYHNGEQINETGALQLYIFSRIAIAFDGSAANFSCMPGPKAIVRPNLFHQIHHKQLSAAIIYLQFAIFVFRILFSVRFAFRLNAIKSAAAIHRNSQHYTPRLLAHYKLQNANNVRTIHRLYYLFRKSYPEF